MYRLVLWVPLPPEIVGPLLAALVVCIPIAGAILKSYLELTLTRLESKLDRNTTITQDTLQRVAASAIEAHTERKRLAAAIDQKPPLTNVAAALSENDKE